MKSLFNLMLVGFVLVGNSIYAQQKGPNASFDVMEYDFGTIKEEDGTVTHKFEFTNTGSEPLLINKVDASCGCTSPNWSKTPVAPGQRGFVSATYNPANRPGKFNKQITVKSNSENANIILRISGNVIPKPKTIEDIYPNIAGSLRFMKNPKHFAFDKVKITEVVTDTLKFYNYTDKDASLKFQNTPPHITIKVIPERIKPSQKGFALISYDGNKKNDWGFVTDNVDMVIDGKPSPDNKMIVSANISEDFSKLSPSQIANAPAITFEKRIYNFGTLKNGETVETEFTFSNNGKSELIIHKIFADCNCTEATASVTKIQPGKEAVIKVKFDSKSRPGTQNRSIKVISNDPKQSEVVLKIMGEVSN